MKKPSDFEMSFLYVLLNGYTLNQNYYNCSDPSAIQGINMKQPFFGWYFLASGIFFVALYIPCIIALLKSDLLKTSCFKIMLCLSIFDILSIIVSSFATGFFALEGANFCDYPRAIFTLGAMGLGAWMGGCLGCVMLAINRCCDLNPNLKLRWMFIGRRTYVVISLIIVYALYSSFFIKPPLFSSEYITWLFNPRINSNPLWYINLEHTTNNCVVSICITSLYTYLCLLFIHKSRHASSDTVSKTQRQVFLQSVLICSFNALAAYIYVYMQYFYSPPIVIIVGQIAWQWSNGSVCIVYLTMNRTIRDGVYKMFIPKMFLDKTKSKAQTIPTRSQTNQLAVSSTSPVATIF